MGRSKSAGLNIHALYEEFKKRTVESKAAHDQDFLIYMVYPRVAARMLVHYSFDDLLGKYETGVKFPFPWTHEIFCGRPELADYIERPQPKPTPEKRFSLNLPRIYEAMDISILIPTMKPRERLFLQVLKRFSVRFVRLQRLRWKCCGNQTTEN
jgi:hypothetical protein